MKVTDFRHLLKLHGYGARKTPTGYDATYNGQVQFSVTTLDDQAIIQALEAALNAHLCKCYQRAAYQFTYRSNDQEKTAYYCEECAAAMQFRAFNQPLQPIDTVLFLTRWISVRQTKHGFQYAERAGKDSVALFLTRLHEGQRQVLIRWQRLVYTHERDRDFPCPVTGSLDKPQLTIEGHVVEEAWEEAGFRIEPKDLIPLGRYAAGTQTSELVHLFACDVSNLLPESRSRISWEPLSFLLTCDYVACQLGYHLIERLENKHNAYMLVGEHG